jgi:organic hydroperoxide reductase OsmC/OhrA
MSLYACRVIWERGGRPFDYEGYSRDHQIRYDTGPTLMASAAVEYRGNPGLPNPEEQLVGALSTCHMLTFLAIAARRGLTVERYEDRAIGTLAKNAEGRLAVTRCVLRPRITFGVGVDVDRAALEKLHQQSHHGCFIAASVKTEVTVDLDSEAA